MEHSQLEISQTLGPGSYSLNLGENYHLYNGFAKDLDSLWINNCTLVDRICDNDNNLYCFRTVGGMIISIDPDFLHLFNKANKNKRCWMFIGKYNEIN